MTVGSMWSYSLVEPFTFAEVEEPKPDANGLAEGQLLLRVLVGGICGSDLPFFRGMILPYFGSVDGPALAPTGCPLHEVVGEVVASRDSAIPEGVKVVGWASNMNAISEYIVVNGHDVHPFDDRLDPTIAIMLQPLACVIYAVDCLKDIEGSTAAVIGQGPIGVLFSHVLKSRGAAKVIGVDRVDRSNIAGTFGVDDSVWSPSDRWASTLLEESDRPNIVVEAVGHQVSTLVDATSVLRDDGGQIYYFGIPDDPIYPFPMSTFLRKNATLISGYTRVAARRDCLRRAEQYIRDYPAIVKPYLSEPFKFSDVEKAFRTAVAPSPGRLKVTLTI